MEVDGVIVVDGYGWKYRDTILHREWPKNKNTIVTKVITFKTCKRCNRFSAFSANAIWVSVSCISDHHHQNLYYLLITLVALGCLNVRQLNVNLSHHHLPLAPIASDRVSSALDRYGVRLANLSACGSEPCYS